MKDKSYFLIFLLGCILLILGIIITIILLLSEEKEEDKGGDEQKKEDWEQYDSYVFSIIWPPSSCFNKWSGNENCYSSVRELKIDDYFIIHGLWPTYKSGQYTESCNKNEEINVNFTIEEQNKLAPVWPGLYSSQQQMWNHEYNKHGYCYIQRIGKNPKEDYKLYFNKTVEIFDSYKYLMEEILPDTPKGLYNVSKTKFKQFLLESSIHLDPSTYSLRCDRNDSKKTNVLNEIRFNYDLDMKMIDDLKSSENCPENFQIYFSNENKKAVYQKYSFYVLSLIWNPSSCKKYGKECYNRIKEKELNILMINGLWPSYENSVEPQWCNIGEDIQIEALPENLNNNMNNYWVVANGTNKDYWKYEYNKFGYCYNQRTNVNVSDYINYFQKTVDLYNQYNLKNLLQEVFPGIFGGVSKIKKETIVNKLTDKWGVGTYTLTCVQNDDKFFLSEVRLKLDLDFNITTFGKTDDNCTEDLYIEFIEVEGPQKQAIGFNETYDMYFFTILWLGTTCQMKGEQCYERISPVPKNSFTIHGLWPNYRNGTLGDWCNGNNDIEIDIHDNDLLEFMNKYYVSGYHTNEYFWGHEFNKHGYCYNQRNNYKPDNYEIYFKKIKDMFLQYDFANIFNNMYKDRIEPGDMEINRNEVENYFESKGFGKDTYVIVCTNITDTNITKVNPHLYEIRIRFDMEFNTLKNETDVSEFDCPEIFYAQFL